MSDPSMFSPQAIHLIGEHLKMRTLEEARDRPEGPMCGWNIRCNVCGSYGAQCLEHGTRPGWGCLCLCEIHKAEWDAEMSRHAEVMYHLRKVNFEQDVGHASAPSKSKPRLNKNKGVK